MITHSEKTNWFHLAIVIAVSAASFFAIKRALDKPFVQRQTYNEVRAAEMIKQN